MDTAAEHARTREQFGRPIGQFQGVKHRLAEHAGLGGAGAWPPPGTRPWSSRPRAAPPSGEETDQGSLSVQLAAALALDGYVEAAKGAIQVLGGMGFTWEHDAHIHLRRATTLRQLVGGTAPLRAESARLALAGWRRRLTIDLPPEAEALRAELDALVAGHRRHRGPRRSASGPWPTTACWPPTGRPRGDGTPAPSSSWSSTRLCAEAGLQRPNLAVAAWALPTIIAHGTPEQTERFVGPTLRGELIWCQLFSEPGAGSDLAALSTRATRVDGGWSLTGQKVWTSVARRAHWGICLARTEPGRAQAPGHHLLPGRHARRRASRSGRCARSPARPCSTRSSSTTASCPTSAWWARSTAGGSSPGRRWPTSGCRCPPDSAFGGRPRGRAGPGGRPARPPGPGHPRPARATCWPRPSPWPSSGMRATLRSVGGLQPGPESSVRKLVGAEFDQRVHEFGLDLCGPDGAVTDGDAAVSAYGCCSPSA